MFETQLHSEPRRLNALYGAVHPVELAGNPAKASSFYEDLLALHPEGTNHHGHFAQARGLLGNLNHDQ